MGPNLTQDLTNKNHLNNVVVKASAKSQISKNILEQNFTLRWISTNPNSHVTILISLIGLFQLSVKNIRCHIFIGSGPSGNPCHV